MPTWKEIPDAMVAEYSPITRKYFLRLRDNLKRTGYHTFPSVGLLTASAVTVGYTDVDVLTFPLYVPNSYVGVVVAKVTLSFELRCAESGSNPSGIRANWSLYDGTNRGTAYAQTLTETSPGELEGLNVNVSLGVWLATAGNAISTIRLQCKKSGGGEPTMSVGATWNGQTNVLERQD